jgi:hypothetical protein
VAPICSNREAVHPPLVNEVLVLPGWGRSAKRGRGASGVRPLEGNTPMMTHWHPESSAPVKTYRVSTLRHGSIKSAYVFVFSDAGVFLLGALLVPAPPLIKVTFGIIAGALLGLYGVRLLDRLSVRIVLTSEGIAYRGLGYQLFSSWEQVAVFGVRTVETEWRNRGRSLTRQVGGLWLRVPALVVQAHFWSGFLYGWKDAAPTFIPLSDCAGYPEAFAPILARYSSSLWGTSEMSRPSTMRSC